jgi:hypothetical protein
MQTEAFDEPEKLQSSVQGAVVFKEGTGFSQESCFKTW